MIQTNVHGFEPFNKNTIVPICGELFYKNMVMAIV